MYFDRFDICEAWYLALSEYHGGQWSSGYRKLSRLTEYFKPSPILSIDSLSENGYEIYLNAVEKLESRG
jgi:hypothetical protein